MFFRNLKFIFILFVIFFAIVFLSYHSAIDKSAGEQGQDISFVVAEGDGVKKISQNLLEAGLIKSKFYFEIYVWRTDQEADFKAGSYILNPMLSAKQVIEILTQGKTADREKTIKIIEGWNVRDVAVYFQDQGMGQSDDFLEMVGYPKIDYRYNKNLPTPRDYVNDFDFLKDKPDYYGLEGYLFPDTYRVFQDALAEDAVLKMLANFDKKLTQEMRQDIISQDKTIYEIVTMASIVEKEVRSVDDMKVVAGIFWDRIKNGQPLQSCATLAYILEENKGQYTVEDTEIDSPYNAYQNRGLTPGPICNPGLQAIEAAIYPEFTDYNYFLSRPDTGETVFSVTYDEHVANKARYLR